MNQLKEKFWIRFNGYSMSPLLHDYDELLIEPLDLNQVSCGEIVLFKDFNSQELTVHRLMELPFKTKGDFSLQYEENPSYTYIGRVIAFRRSDVYFQLSQNRLLQKMFLFFSKMRTQNKLIRKIGLAGLFILVKTFSVYSAKTT